MTSFFLFFYLLFAGLSPANETRNLTLNISNIENISGTLKIGIFNESDQFLKEGQAFRAISVDVKANSQIIVIKDLPKGTYAISMYHDENADGICNRNFIGIPIEPYGFSNNFRPKFAPPKFQDCEFKLEFNQTMAIELKK